MKRDQDYIKRLLEAFEESEAGYVYVNKIDGFDYKSDLFIFHMKLLAEKRLVCCHEANSTDIGIREDNKGKCTWCIWRLRLTNDGHDYLADIRK